MGGGRDTAARLGLARATLIPRMNKPRDIEDPAARMSAHPSGIGRANTQSLRAGGGHGSAGAEAAAETAEGGPSLRRQLFLTRKRSSNESVLWT